MERFVLSEREITTENSAALYGQYLARARVSKYSPFMPTWRLRQQLKMELARRGGGGGRVQLIRAGNRPTWLCPPPTRRPPASPGMIMRAG